MPTDLRLLRSAQLDMERAAEERSRIAAAAAQGTARIDRLEQELALVMQTGDAAAVAETKRRLAAAADARRADLGRLREVDRRFHDIAGSILERIDPCDADPSVPLLLLPVRLETRYEQGVALRVRIYPDDVHIDQLDEGLDEDEQEAWQEYWSAVWRAEDDAAKLAWQQLVQRTGSRRALYIAAALPPANLDRRRQDPAPIRGEVPDRARHAAAARLLPDAFVVTVVQGNETRSVTGRPIAPAVTMGVLADDGSTLADVDGLRVAEGAEWIADYAAAVELGMAVNVPLPRPHAGVDGVFVMGVRRTWDPERTAAELESLLRAHQCTRGFEVLTVGTPSNNTETGRTGWREHARPARPAVEPPAPPQGSDGRVLAEALGLRPALFATVAGAAQRQQAQARAAHVAFWPSTWGSFLEKANQVADGKATLSGTTIEAARAFHRDSVRGRGPLPSVRIGRQPYGILPVSTLDEQRWRVAPNERFEAGLIALLRRVRERWRHALGDVPRVGAGKIDEVMRNLLGTAPVSTAVRVRTVLSGPAAQLGLRVSNGDAAADAVESLIEELILEELILNASLVRRTGSLASRSRPLNLPLAHESDVACMEALLAGSRPPKVASVWQALLRLSWDAVQRDVAAGSGAAGGAVGGAGGTAVVPGGRFSEIVRLATVLDAADQERAIATAGGAERLGSQALYQEAERLQAAMTARVPPATLEEYQPLPGLRQGFAELALNATSANARAALAGHATVAHLEALGRQREMREALAELVKTDAGQRAILMGEVLDVASHRLDAWLTGVVEQRRARVRRRAASGLTVGAYGWVENIAPPDPNPRAGDRGYVVAPSLAHAATAGVLRAAYLSHNANDGSGAYAIDLSSARVRSAMLLVDGIRNGQPLAALLGYRLERGINDARLGRLVLSLRTIAPLTQGKLTDRGTNESLAAIEALAAGNVTDGIDLVEKYRGRVGTWSAQRVRDSLDRRPDNPYLGADQPWPALTDDDWNTVRRIIEDVAADLDAVGDLLMAESVHQLVQGNMARASAAMDAVSAGEAPPPVPDVISTPLHGMPLTHRMLLVVNGDGVPWRLDRPRAAAEPTLEAWAGRRLGAPDTIVVSDRGPDDRLTLADTGLCALDIVHGAADRRLLEQQLRRALELPADAALAAAPDGGWPPGFQPVAEVLAHAAVLHELLLAARVAGPSDLVRPQDELLRTWSLPSMASCAQRLAYAHGGMGALVAELDAALEEPVADPAIHAALDRAAAYGIVVPDVAAEQLPVLAAAVRTEADRRADTAERHLDAVRPLVEAATADPDELEQVRDGLVAAAQALFGDGFRPTLELAAAAGPDLWARALGPDGVRPAAGAVRRFLADVGSVRETMKRVGDALLLAEAAGTNGVLRVAQLAPPDVEGADRWVGGMLDPAAPTPDEPITSILLDAPDDHDAAGTTAAFVLDQWTDVLAVRERRGTANDAVIDERTAAAVSFNADAPSARAPQAMLLAVSPNGERWTSQLLLRTLVDTLELARLRMVTLERTNGIARVLPALYARSWSLQGEPALNLGALLAQDGIQAIIAPYVKE
jgi:hypothetical protein